MMFKDRLKKAMQELNLNQSQVAGITGKSKASVSQYLSGQQVPPEQIQQDIAAALGLEPDYFTRPDTPSPACTELMPKRHGAVRLLGLKETADLLGVDKETVAKGLQQRVFPWGYGVKTSEHRWRYIINADSFSRIEGVVV